MEVDVGFVQLHDFPQSRSGQEERHDYCSVPDFSKWTPIRLDNSQKPTAFILGQSVDFGHPDFWKGNICSGIVSQQPCSMSIFEKRPYSCQGPGTSRWTVWLLVADFREPHEIPSDVVARNISW
jgi:hypothetical protein